MKSLKIILSVLLLSVSALAETADFETGKSTLSQSLVDKLQKDAESLTSDEIAFLLVEAHADKRGSSEYNMKLTEARANEVKAVLESIGVRAKIVTVAKGKTEQLKGASLAENRRVIITKFKKEKEIVRYVECKKKKNILSAYLVRSRVGLESEVVNLNGEVKTKFGEGLGVMYQREILTDIWLGVGIDSNSGKQISIGVGF